MNSELAREALARAERLAASTSTAGRWAVRYYVIFGLASFLYALSLVFLRGSTTMAVPTIVFVAVIAGLTIYANSRCAIMRGLGRVHASVMVAWTLVWLATILIGTRLDLGSSWWLAGGAAMLAICLGGAWAAHRCTSGAARS